MLWLEFTRRFGLLCFIRNPCTQISLTPQPKQRCNILRRHVVNKAISARMTERTIIIMSWSGRKQGAPTQLRHSTRPPQKLGH